MTLGSRRSAPDEDALGPDADPVELARAICLRQLQGQPRTRAELASALRRRHVPQEAAEEVLARFTEVGLIDDAAFAQAWVSTRHAGRGLARRALSAELRRRGVDAPVIAEAVEAVDDETELASARALVARRLAATRGQPAPARIRRLVGVLARKGYSGGVAMRVVREALAAEQTEAELEAWFADEWGDDEAELTS